MSKKKEVYQSTDFGIAGICFEREMAQKKIDQLTKENEVLRKTLVRVSNEKTRIIDKQNIDYLSFASQLRHEICEKIRNLAGNYFEFPICESCGETLFASSDVIMTGSDFEKILQEVEKGEE